MRVVTGVELCDGGSNTHMIEYNRDGRGHFIAHLSSPAWMFPTRESVIAFLRSLPDVEVNIPDPASSRLDEIPTGVLCGMAKAAQEGIAQCEPSAATLLGVLADRLTDAENSR